MPTYGKPETAKDFPANDELVRLRVKMMAIEAKAQRELDPLEVREEIIVEHCPHHWTPKADATEGWKMTLVPGVFHAGKIPELDERNCGQSFELECSRCSESKKVHISEHCPICASETSGNFDRLSLSYDSRPTYFGTGNFGYNSVWLITCTNKDCGFKAAGLRWDQ